MNKNYTAVAAARLRARRWAGHPHKRPRPRSHVECCRRKWHGILLRGFWVTFGRRCGDAETWLAGGAWVENMVASQVVKVSWVEKVTQ